MSFLYLLLFSVLISTSKSQTTPPKPTTPPAPAPVPPPSDSCNGVYLSYTYIIGERLPPTPANAYRFESRARILNNGREDLKQWRMFIGFKHDEYLVSASKAILADGTSLPAKVGNGTVFAGFPMTDLKTAIETAGDDTQMGLEIHLVGTQFGVAPPKFPMPENISLANDGFSCPSPNLNGTFMDVCCVVDKNFKANITQEEFLPRQSGDLTIDYDITRSYDSDYWAQVKIANHNSLGRLDYWQLSWDWMRDEFIMKMQGAYPSVLDTTGCFFGPQGAYYKDMDLSTALNCQRRPTIVDLPLTKANDSVLGKIPFCCRNGTILPPSMDPTRSTSAFQIQVKKMPPDLNRTELNPPQNWRINGTLNPDYQCGPPIRVSPSQFPDSSGLPLNKTAIASWQVVCNITQHKGSIPKCCVSFSAYYNDSAIPCNTCACGCPRNPSQTCNADAQALLLPPDSLLVPFDNRTKKATEWYRIKHGSKPQTPLPCSDNCGVSINWHVFSDYRKGWTARMTLFNWGETNFADWFAALEFNKAAPGFEKMYSFDGFALNDTENTIFVQGLSGLNYLVAERDSDKPLKDPRVPGKQQSVISFTKALTPGINVVRGDGFPTKVFFNGEECALPPFIPNSGHRNALGISIWSFLVAVIVLILMQQ